MAREKIGNFPMRLGIWIVVSLAAINLGLIEFADTDLLVDVAGLSGQGLTAAYAGIAAAGAVNFFNTVTVEAQRLGGN